ncbi:hypothetical protein [Streptomyces anulatus]|nr:hypothetical protein OG238_40515 [Streptomyces anulatus]
MICRPSAPLLKEQLDAGLVASARREIERMRMLEWEMTGVHPSDTDPDTE